MNTRILVASVLLCTAMAWAAPARAQDEGPPPPSLDVAARLGLVQPLARLGTFVMPGIEVGSLLPVLDRRLLVAVDAAWTQPSYSTPGTSNQLGASLNPYTTHITESELVLGIDAIYLLHPPLSSWNAYLGLEPLAYMMKTSETNSFDPGATNTNQQTKYGIGALGGADLRLGPGDVFGDLRLIYSSTDQKLTGNADVGNFVLSAGYRLFF